MNAMARSSGYRRGMQKLIRQQGREVGGSDMDKKEHEKEME